MTTEARAGLRRRTGQLALCLLSLGLACGDDGDVGEATSAGSSSSSGGGATSGDNATSATDPTAGELTTNDGGTTTGEATGGVPTTSAEGTTSGAGTTTGDTRTTGDPTMTGDSTTTGDTTGDTSGGDDGVVILEVEGDFFTASPMEPRKVFANIGEGEAYRRLELDIDVKSGEFREDIPPNNEERWDHILVDVSREGQPESYLRYLFGASARIETQAQDRAFNYGRVSLTKGASSYISWKKAYPWEEGADYHLHQWIDADASEQGLEVYRDGALERTIIGAVDYYTADLTASGLEVAVGGEDADWGLHVSPHGWSFSDLVVRAWE